MRKQKNKRKNSKFIKPLMAAKYAEEARRVLEQRSGRESRFLDAVPRIGEDLEPIGCLAG
jgi:hypothetical protein